MKFSNFGRAAALADQLLQIREAEKVLHDPSHQKVFGAAHAFGNSVLAVDEQSPAFPAAMEAFREHCEFLKAKVIAELNSLGVDTDA